jgi:MFS transporter, ACS family, tartrate transporter
MLLIEAVPAVLLGVFVFFWLTDRLELATWLRPDQGEWLRNELAREEARVAKTASLPFLKIVTMSRVWSLSILFVCFLTAFYGVFFGFRKSSKA